jgi:hypothetical protein
MFFSTLQVIWGKFGVKLPDLVHIRGEIERMRVQVGRQRKEILGLQRAGISTASAELLLTRKQSKIEDLCAQRDRLKKEQPVRKMGALGGRSW